jgi:prolyl 4-hydroxylase
VNRLEVKANVGTAIFWYNVDPDGVVDDMTLHAGAPVVQGTKVGLNIWTRERGYRVREE